MFALYASTRCSPIVSKMSDLTTRDTPGSISHVEADIVSPNGDRRVSELEAPRLSEPDMMSISTSSSNISIPQLDGGGGAQQGASRETLTGIETAAASQPVILTPSRLRIDSRVLVAHATSQWLMNGVFAVLILLKLGGPLQNISWFAVFLPQWLGHGALYGLQITILYMTVR